MQIDTKFEERPMANKFEVAVILVTLICSNDILKRLQRLFGSVFLAILALALSSPANADVISDRVDGFKASKKGVSSIKDAIAAGDHRKVASAALAIADFAEHIPSLFPTGSKGGFFSGAKENIWNDFPDFSEKAKHLKTDSRLLADLAQSGTADKVALTEALAKVSDGCKSCHQAYKKGR